MKKQIDSFLDWAEPIPKFLYKLMTGIKILLGIGLLLWIGNIILNVIYAHVWIMYILDGVFLILLIAFLYRNTHKQNNDAVISTLLLLIGLLILFSLPTLIWNFFICIGIVLIGSIYGNIRKNQKPGTFKRSENISGCFFCLEITIKTIILYVQIPKGYLHSDVEEKFILGNTCFSEFFLNIKIL